MDDKLREIITKGQGVDQAQLQGFIALVIRQTLTALLPPMFEQLKTDLKKELTKSNK